MAAIEALFTWRLQYYYFILVVPFLLLFITNVIIADGFTLKTVIFLGLFFLILLH